MNLLQLAPREEQLAFLERELSQRGTCRLPFWHTSRYSEVPDGDEEVVARKVRRQDGRGNQNGEKKKDGFSHSVRRLRTRDYWVLTGRPPLPP